MAAPPELPKPTPAELELLQALWPLGTATARQLHEALRETRPELAYGAVLRLMQVMHGKGLLTRDESARAHVYAPAQAQDSIQTSLLKELIHKAFAGSGKALVLAALRGAGFEVPIVTGGGTGTFAIDASLGVFTELQVGSYVFLDREYTDCELAGPRFEPALFVDATVVSANTPGMVTIDAGLKAFATDAGVPVVLDGAPPASRYAFTGDEHGALLGEGLPGLGGRVTLMPPHCDPTVNLYDLYHVLDGDTVSDTWPVTARGRSS